MIVNPCVLATFTNQQCSSRSYGVANDLFLYLNKGNMAVLALHDFSSAYDTIDHSILVYRHHTDFGFTDTVLQ